MTHHPNTPAAIQAIRALLDASMVALTDVTTATPESVAIWNNAGEAIDALASRTEQAAPSVASGVESKTAVLNDLKDWLEGLVEANFNGHVPQGVFSEANEYIERIEALAAPGAAIAAREPCATCGASEPFTGSCGTSDSDTRALCKRASRQEAPAASAVPECTCCGCGGCKSCLSGRNRCPKHLAARSPATVAQPVELRGVAETLGNGGGFWRSCSGCHELNEGHATGPYSAVLKCHLGGGCSECGGIGAIWDTTDYADMADHMGASLKTAAQPCHSQGCGGDGGEAVRRVSADEDKILRSAALDSSVLVAHGRAVEVCPECDIADCRHIRERRRAALSGLEHVGKESE